MVCAACSNSGQEVTSIAELGSIPSTDGTSDESSAAIDDSALRRSYGPSEMKFHECMMLQADGSIVGENCPSAFVLFGPYISAPNNSDVDLTFTIEPSNKIVMSSDIVSEVAKNFHAALRDEEIAPNEVRKVAYRVHFFQPVNGVETRLWIRGDGPTRFKIANFALDVK
jgi:hypothetical protein